jgi:uncharacterized glyoxalase superfamily protein PhnB
MRIAAFVLLMLISLTMLPLGQPKAEEKIKTMTIKRITPVLFAEEIEPCVKFWVEKMGFQKTSEVPGGNKLAFVMLKKGNVELMYQTYASAEKDVPAVSQLVRKGPTFLYIEVDNLEDTIAAIKGAEVVVPVRTTFYGAKEIGVKDPAGHLITFAQFGTASQP